VGERDGNDNLEELVRDMKVLGCKGVDALPSVLKGVKMFKDLVVVCGASLEEDGHVVGECGFATRFVQLAEGIPHFIGGGARLCVLQLGALDVIGNYRACKGIVALPIVCADWVERGIGLGYFALDVFIDVVSSKKPSDSLTPGQIVFWSGEALFSLGNMSCLGTREHLDFIISLFSICRRGGG